MGVHNWVPRAHRYRVPLFREIMACLNSPRHGRRKKAQRAKWGFELELEELQALAGGPCACGSGGDSSGCSVGGGVLVSSSEDGSEPVAMPPISRFVLEGSKLETKVISVRLFLFISYIFLISSVSTSICVARSYSLWIYLTTRSMRLAKGMERGSKMRMRRVLSHSLVLLTSRHDTLRQCEK